MSITNLQEAIGTTVAAVEDFSTARNGAQAVKDKLKEITSILAQATEDMESGEGKLQEVKSWLENLEAELFAQLGTESTVAQHSATASEAAAQVAIIAADTKNEVESATEYMAAGEAGADVVLVQTAAVAVQAENLARILGSLE